VSGPIIWLTDNFTGYGLDLKEQNRILVVGRQQDFVDSVTHLLEGVGCIVASTLIDSVAIDLAVSSEYDALLIDDEVPQLDGGFIATAARNKRPSLAVIKIHGLDSLLTQLRLAGVHL
jgi:CheY-like chemotaxis protein